MKPKDQSLGSISTLRRTLRDSTIFKLLLLLVMFEHKQKKVQEEWDRNYELERQIFEKNYKRKIEKMMLLLVMFEDKQKKVQEEWARNYELEREICEKNQKRKIEKMIEYNNGPQEYYTQMDDMERCRLKRARSGVAAVGAAICTQQSVHRKLWVKDRSQSWWQRCNHPDFPDSKFHKSFRMSRANFDHICEELNSAVAKKDTMLRAAIPVRQRVAACIWRLATGEPLHLVSTKFGLGMSTCHKLVLDVCHAIHQVLLPKYIQWPTKDRMLGTMKEFKRISGIPKVVGAMYTTHIPIVAPKANVAAYKRHTERNQRTSYSMTLQGVVDNTGSFTDICIAWPGSMSDDTILGNSDLFKLGVGGFLDGFWVVGSSNYPFLDWLLVPYVQHNTWTQYTFNEKISDIQKIAKDAFIRLKGRWRCLEKRTEANMQDLAVVLGACCVLHNICEQNNEGFDPDLAFKWVDDEICPEICVRSGSSMKARDSIADNLLHPAHAGTSFL